MHTVRLPAIQRIPVELFCEIFKNCLPEDAYSAVSRHAAPLLVSQVCATWRGIVLSTPTLWSSLRVSIIHIDRVPHISLIKLWLDRSRATPLSLCFELDKFPPVSATFIQLAASILDIFATVSLRWRSLKLVLPGSHKLLHTIFDVRAPNLEVLNLDLRNWSQDETAEINLLLRSTLCLRRLSWSNRPSWGSWDTPFRDVVTTLQVSWCDITHLVFDTCLNLENSYQILRQCRRLVSCDLRHFAGGSPTVNLPSLTLPHLISMKIYQHDPDEGLGYFFDVLRCPGLKIVSVTCGYVLDGFRWVHVQFKSFLCRSSCSLQSLSLEFTGVTEDQLTQYLQASNPSLSRLEVYGMGRDVCVTDTLLKMLTCRKVPIGRRGPLCPNLRALILHNVLVSTDGVLSRMLTSRMEASSSSTPSCVRFEHIDLVFSITSGSAPDLNLNDLNYLRKLSSEGFDILAMIRRL